METLREVLISCSTHCQEEGGPEREHPILCAASYSFLPVENGLVVTGLDPLF